jgi:tellurite resistance protein TerC
MFVVLLVIETSDILFALDSIPAVLAITKDQFIVFSSNAMAILGLRTLYFALSAVVEMFHYLHYGLAVILVFVGVKMIISEFYVIPTLYALGFIILILAIAIGASILFPPKEVSGMTNDE